MSTPKGTVPWNKGTGKGWTDKRGYRWRYVLLNGKPRQVREHRWVMEQYLGRKLEPHEMVHHLNGDTTDNRIENLELTTWAEHTKTHHIGAKRPDSHKETLAVQSRYRGEVARLKAINAAMYEALRQAYAHLAEMGCDCEEWQSCGDCIVCQCETALAQAEGR